MKKNFVLCLAATLSVLCSCNKYTYTVVDYEYYTCGNEISGDGQNSQPVVYCDNREMLRITGNAFAADLCKYGNDIYTAGYKTENGVKYPVIWKNEKENGNEHSGREGALYTIGAFNVGVISLGEVKDGDYTKGVMLLDGKTAFEFSEKEKNVSFRKMALSSNSIISIAGYIDDELCIWPLYYDGNAKAFKSAGEKTVLPDSKMDYGKYSYNLNAMTADSFSTYLALGRVNKETGLTQACYTQGTNPVLVCEDESETFAITLLNNGIFNGGRIYDEEKSVFKACAWNYYGISDYSEGFDKGPSSIFASYGDNFGFFHVGIYGEGKVQYQVFGSVSSSVNEFECSKTYTPTNFIVIGTTRTVTEER